MSTIALVGIVKDERPIIERMFRSVEGLIDTWLLIDTGSTDGTLEYLESRGDGHVKTSTFVDFSSNRNEVFRLAEQVLSVDYWLLFDADFVMEVLHPLPDLAAEAYQLEHLEKVTPGQGPGYHYWVPRIIKARPGWRWVGRTHEYLQIPEGTDVFNLREWRIIDHTDGSSRTVKAERDLKLLLEDWDDPSGLVDKKRTAAYLASTYAMMKNEAECLNWLRKRLQMGGDRKELYNYQYQLAGWTRDPADMMRAWILSPDRAEPLAWVGQYFMENGDFDRVYQISKLAMQIPFPENSALVSSNVYDYDILWQAAVSAYETGRLDEAILLGRQLLSRNLPEEVRAAAEANMAEFLTTRFPHA